MRTLDRRRPVGGPLPICYMPLICPICSRGFNSRADRDEHVAHHDKIKPGLPRQFPCYFCDKSYAHKQSLYLHLRIHDEKRVFNCTVCKQRFPLQSTLEKHMRIHNKVKPHSCPTCKKSFRTTANLNTHLTIHTGKSITN